MTKETLKLCYYASELYESKKYTANQIYDLLTKTQSRKKEVTKARQLVSYFLYNHYNLTLKEITKEINLINHTTIMYHIDQVYFSLRTDKRMKYRHDFMLDIINGLERTVIRNKPISRNVLSQDDKDFIFNNLNQGYSISYYSDVLNKTKCSIKYYLHSLKKENINTFRKNQIKIPNIVNKQIDY
jgi:hypothetical protein